jgi:hypothetical protein
MPPPLLEPLGLDFVPLLPLRSLLLGGQLDDVLLAPPMQL